MDKTRSKTNQKSIFDLSSDIIKKTSTIKKVSFNDNNNKVIRYDNFEKIDDSFNIDTQGTCYQTINTKHKQKKNKGKEEKAAGKFGFNFFDNDTISEITKTYDEVQKKEKNKLSRLISKYY